MGEYNDTIKYWDNIFGQANISDPRKVIKIQKIEDGISWLAKDSKSIIDFGCGNGAVLLRSLYKGIDYGYGIDISNNAIKIANKIIREFNLENKVDLICGGIGKLNEIDNNFFESAILFNILDNLEPEDSINLIKQIHRIVKPNGKILLKLNPYITAEERKEYNFIEIFQEFYKEESGLYLWNLTEAKLHEIISPYFIIEKHEKIEFKEFNTINRMYYLRNK